MHSTGGPKHAACILYFSFVLIGAQKSVPRLS